jgi:hypothetical protein
VVETVEEEEEEAWRMKGEAGGSCSESTQQAPRGLGRSVDVQESVVELLFGKRRRRKRKEWGRRTEARRRSVVVLQP